MKPIFIRLPIFSLASSCLLLILTACNSQPPEMTAPASTETERPTAETTVAVLTEEQLDQREKELAERGALNIATLEEASQIAGYEVSTPAFIPEDFRRNRNIMISQHGVGLPEDMATNFPKEVQQMWMWKEDSSVWFILTQSPKKFGVGSSGDKFSLSWDNGNMYYGLSGTLAGPLTKEVLNSIASSVGTD